MIADRLLKRTLTRVDFHAIDEEEQGNGPTATASAVDDGYGRQLAAACGQVFRYSSAMHGSV